MYFLKPVYHLIRLCSLFEFACLSFQRKIPNRRLCFFEGDQETHLYFLNPVKFVSRQQESKINALNSHASSLAKTFGEFALVDQKVDQEIDNEVISKIDKTTPRLTNISW